MVKWLYGKSWEAYPIGDGEIWKAGKNRVLCSDIESDDTRKFLHELPTIDMTYIDPPWNTSLLKGFRTKAGFDSKNRDIDSFLLALVRLVKSIDSEVNYIEIGKQKLEYLKKIILDNDGFISDVWNATYYMKNPMHIVRYYFGIRRHHNYGPLGFNGLDDSQTPNLSIKYERAETVLDLCAGRGLTAKSSYSKATFYGVELNRRRLANLLDWYGQQGETVCKMK